MDFYMDTEPWMFPKYQYPTWDDCMRFYMSRVKVKVPMKTAMLELAEAVHQIWKAGDGCPKSETNIITQFERSVYSQYQKYRKGDGVKKDKQKKYKGPVQSSTRKSLRHPSTSSSSDSSAPTHEIEPGDHDGQQAVGAGHVPEPIPADFQPQSSKRKDAKERKDSWMHDHGDNLFDIFSETAMVRTLKEGRCFDADFYEDQKDPRERKLIIETVRVRKEFVEAEKQLNSKKARKFARKLNALGKKQLSEDTLMISLIILK